MDSTQQEKTSLNIVAPQQTEQLEQQPQNEKTDEAKASEEAQQGIHEGVSDSEKIELESTLQLLAFAYALVDKQNILKVIEILYQMIVLKKKLKRRSEIELHNLAISTLQIGDKLITRVGLELFYKLKDIIPQDDAEDMSLLYQYICSAELILGNSDAAQFVIEEAIKYITEKGVDKNGLLVSGIIRTRTKIYENRQQYQEYVDDHKLSISILENCDPALKTEFHDKYIAQMVPQYIEVEIEQLKVYDFENQEKNLIKAYNIWKVREGDHPKDFCNFKTTYLLLVLYSKFKQLEEYRDILKEGVRNMNILKSIQKDSKQYENTYIKSVFLFLGVFGNVLESGNTQVETQSKNEELERQDNNESVYQKEEKDEEKNKEMEIKNVDKDNKQEEKKVDNQDDNKS